MKLQTKLLFIVAFFVLAIPLICSVKARAAVFNTDGATHNATTGGWDVPTAPGSGFNNCLYCHQGSIASDKSGYLLGGHKNMSRPADGLKWTMPGVDATHPFLGDSAEAGIGSDGSFFELWIKEDYPRIPVDWTAKTIFQGYCGNADGTTNSNSLPNLLVCPTCETPIFGDGNAGYPLGYADSATCTAAGFTWFGPTTKPLYWIYGGAGLEGGPPMYEPGAQNYKCGRCHTTGYTADTVANTTKHPYDLNPSMNTVTIVGSTTLLLNPSKAGYTLSSWDQWGIQCSRCHTAKDGSHDTWPTAATKGGDIVALCMNCHRQESDAKPRSQSGTVITDLANPTVTNTVDINITPYTNKQQQPDGFAHHPDGNEFLNSPHARFTGTFKDIGCPPYAIDGYTSITPGAPGAPTDCSPGAMNLDGSTSSLYASKFGQAAKVDLGASDSSAGSCVTCHDVHQPLNNNIAGMSKSVKVACTDCHSKSGGSSVTPQINVGLVRHHSGVGTPLENASTDPSSACMICHQPPGVKHLWRINADANYTMYGDYTHVDPPSGNVVPSHMANDSSGYSAMWVDLDNACGQCHGGGVSGTEVTTTGSIVAGTAPGNYTLTVADATGFASGKEITIEGAGVGGGPHKTIIASVSGNTVYLTYKASTTVTGAAVTAAGNPTANYAPYFTKVDLARNAACIHRDVTSNAVIHANADAHGSISPSGTVSLSNGSSQTFTITPDAGYEVRSVIVDGANWGALTTYTFTNVMGCHSITAHFKPITYTITATAGAGGSISPPGTTVLSVGAGQTYTITPAAGYHITDVLVDGLSVGAVTTYPFTNITANHTISATFAANPSYTITASADANGTISPSGSVSVLGGANQKFTITPAAGYRVADVLVDGSSVGARTSYTFYSVQAVHTISATFVLNVYSINVTAATGGSVTVSGASITTTTVNGGASSTITVNPGASVTLTITPDAGRSVRSLVDNGSYRYGITTYTLTSIGKDHTINVYFK